MIPLKKYIEDRIELIDPTCSYDDIQSIVIRLLNTQSLWGEGQSEKERKMYLLAQTFYDVLVEIFELLVCRLFQNPAWQIIYLLPSPASHAMDSEESLDVEDFYTFKRMSKHEIMLMLTLRFIYQQVSMEGGLTRNSAPVTLGEINHAHFHIFSSHLPDSTQAKSMLFRALKKARVVEFGELASPEDVVVINVMILLYDISPLQKHIEEINSSKKVSSEAGDIK